MRPVPRVRKEVRKMMLPETVQVLSLPGADALVTVPEIMAVSFLAVQGWLDFRKREISLLFSLLTAGAGILHMFLNRRGEMPECFLALLPGFFLLLISFASKGKIGQGDGIVLLTCGFFLTGILVTEMLLLALVLSSVFAVFLVALRKKKKTESFPFVPFLCAGCIGALLI